LFGEQRRERPLARAEVRNGQRREERDQGVGQRLPGTTRAMVASKTSGELVEIFARLVLALAQNDFQRGAVALRLGHLAGERAGQLTDLGTLPVEFLAIR